MPRDKRPLLPWEPFRHRPPLPAELALWRARWPEANVGIVTGAVSGLVVLDVDPEKGGEASLAALEATFGRRPLYIREGGSVPVAASFAANLGLPVVLLGFAPPDGNFHAPNEWMDLDNYEGGIRTVVRFFDALAGASS